MDIRVAGHQLETGQAFRTHAEDRLGVILSRHVPRAVSAQVTLSPGPHDSYVCDVVVNAGQGLLMKGSARGSSAQQALDGAADRIEKQLRRHNRRLKSRSARPKAEAGGEDALPAEYRVFEPELPEAEGDPPLTIAESRVDIPVASVADAVMMLDLRNTTALLFRNTRTQALNMVYRREDGNIGWVEPAD